MFRYARVNNALFESGLGEVSSRGGEGGGLELHFLVEYVLRGEAINKDMIHNAGGLFLTLQSECSA